MRFFFFSFCFFFSFRFFLQQLSNVLLSFLYRMFLLLKRDNESTNKMRRESEGERDGGNGGYERVFLFKSIFEG